MRRAIVIAVLLGSIAALPAPARAGTSTDVALGLASFAVFNQVVGPFLRGPAHSGWHPRREVVVHRTVVRQPVVYTTPAPVYVTPAVVAAPVATAYAAPPPTPSVIQYPHGRQELHWTGQQYVWVWVPTVPAPPPPPPLPPAVQPVPTPTIP